MRQETPGATGGAGGAGGAGSGRHGEVVAEYGGDIVVENVRIGECVVEENGCGSGCGA